MAITVYHLQISQSERIIWLCEELGLDYNLKIYSRCPLFAPPEFKALHPAGSAPVIQDGDLMLAESGACIEYIVHKHSDGSLFLPPSHPEYANFLYWWHWANATLQPNLGRAMSNRAIGLDESSPMFAFGKSRVDGSLKQLDDRLRDNEWLAGKDFTVADIMVVFPLTTMRYFAPYSLKEYGNILAYLERIGKREAYQKAMKKGDPELELVLGADPPKETKI